MVQETGTPNSADAIQEFQHAARILLVDDDRLILATLSKGLKHSGYLVLQAATGEEALRLAHQHRPDLALLDMRMPGMSGLDVAEELRRDDVPFIFLSAYGETDVVKEAVARGALCYLVKPVDLPQLLPPIEAALGRACEIQALRTNQGHLNAALNNGREISTAVGLVMERYRLPREVAFEVLRNHARANRRKLSDLAGDLIRASGVLNLPINPTVRNPK